MKFFDKIKKYIRRLFVDYGKINKMIENHSEITNNILVEESNNVKQIEKKLKEELSIQNQESLQKIEIELKKDINEKVSSISEKLDKMSVEIEKNRDNAELERSLFNIYQELEKIKYCNFELQNIKRDESKKNILIVGFYGAPNLGDELMLETLLDYFEDITNKKITILLADNPNYSIDKYKDVSFLHYPKNLCDYNILAEQYDYVIFGGGAIIDDKQYESCRSYTYDLGTILIKLAVRAIAFNKKVICLGLSSSRKLSNIEYIEKLKYIIEKATFFSVRDIYSKEYLVEKIGKEYENKIISVNDIVFSNKNILGSIRTENVIKETLNIGLVVISNDDNLGKIENIIYGISNLKKNVNINLIPFYEYNSIDTIFYEKVLQKKYDNVTIHMEKFPENMKETIEVYNKNDIIIGMRYHSILMANILNIPCLSICYDIHEHYLYKIKYLNELFKQGEAVSYKNINSSQITERLENIIKNIDYNNLYEFDKKILLESKNQMFEILKMIFASQEKNNEGFNLRKE